MKTSASGRNVVSKSLFNKGIVSFLIKVANLVLSSLVVLILARALGPAEFGKYAFFIAFVSICTIPAQMGLPQLIVRETAQAQAIDCPQIYISVWRWAHIFVIVSSVVIIGVIFLFSELLLETWPLGDFRLLPFSLIILLALGSIRGACLRGLGKVLLGQLPELLLRPGLFIVLCLAVFFIVGSPRTFETAVSVQIIAALLAYLIGTVLLFRNTPALVGVTTGTPLKFRFLGTVLIFGLTSGAQLLSTNIDLVMLGYMQDTEAVAVYRSSASISKVVTFGLQALSVVILPLFARSFQENDIESVRYFAYRVTRWSMLYSVTACILIWSFGEQVIILLFGEAYSGGHSALFILALAQFVNAFFGPVGALLIMSGLERFALFGMLLGLVFNVVLNWLLIPRYGVDGAALAFLASTFVWNCSLWRIAQRKLGINTLGHLFDFLPNK